MSNSLKRLRKAIGLAVAFGVVAGAIVSVNARGEPSADEREYIIKDGMALGKIYTPPTCGKATQFAVRELQLHLKEMTGADVKLSWRNDGKGRVGRKDTAGFMLRIRPESEWKGKESSQNFTIEQVAKPHPLVTITGNTDLAVLYGVYQYLGDLGVKWLAPGEIGTNIPRVDAIAVKPGKRVYSPSFKYRCLSLSSTPGNHFGGTGVDMEIELYDYYLFLLRNRAQFEWCRFGFVSDGPFSFNTVFGSGGHAVKPRTGLTKEAVKNGLMETNPERFALVTGPDGVQKRKYAGGQVCFSNRENIQNAIDSCVNHFKKLDESKDERCGDLDELYIVDMMLSDCFGICECENCRKIAGRGPLWKDRLVWNFWNKVARGLAERMPGRIMAVSSPYLDLTMPPDDVVLEPNLKVGSSTVYRWEKNATDEESYPFTRFYYDVVKQLRKCGAKQLSCYNYLNFPWSPTSLHILDLAEGFTKLGYDNYHLETMQRTEYSWPLIWALAQYLWNTDQKPRSYFKEYCDDYFGEKYGKDVAWIFEEMTKNALTMDRIIFGSPADNAYLFPDAFITQARGKLRVAANDTQGKQHIRLARFQQAIETQFLMAQVYRAYVKALEERTDEAIATFQKRAKGLIKFWDRYGIERYNSTGRTPKVAANLYLKTDFESLKPAGRKVLEGKTPKDEEWLRELFAGTKVPEKVPNLFPLPEIWRFHLDIGGKGIEEGWGMPEYDDSQKGWNDVSTWAGIESQGYKRVEGHFCYRLKFKAPKFPAGKKVFLRIGSLDDSGDVYLNGVKVGSQPQPRDWDKSFEMDVTKEIKPGAENVLAVYGYDAGGGMGVWRPSALYTD